MRIEPRKAKYGKHNTMLKDVEELWLDIGTSGQELLLLDPLNNDADAIRLAEETLGIPQLPAEQDETIQMLETWHRLVREELRALHGTRESTAALLTRPEASA